MADIENTEYKSTNPIIQKCLDILKVSKLKIHRVSDFNSFTVYCNEKRAFNISKSAVFDTPDCVMYDLDIDNIQFDTKHLYKGLDFSDLKILYNLCVSEYDKQEEQRRQHVLNYLDDCKSTHNPEPKTNNKNDAPAPTEKQEIKKYQKNEKPQYAVPYEVNEVQEYLNAEKGLVGYNIGVRFKGLSNFPTPHFFDCENMHMYQDVNAGTSRVVYHFPFVGHGLINFGKLRAEHWYKKMKKQVEACNAKQKTK